MSEIELITKIYKLHEMRRHMSTYSLYHGQYVLECVVLNTTLVRLSGKNYNEYTSSEIKNALADYELLLEAV